MSSIHGFISGQLGKCIEVLEKTENPNEKNLSELDRLITQIAKIPLNNKFDTQLDKLIHLISNKYKKEDGNAILEKITSIRKNVFSEGEKLTWMQIKVSEGIEQTMGLIEDLDLFDFKNTSRTELLDLCLMIVEQGEKAQVSFVKNLDKLRLDPLDCLDLCGKIAQKNPEFIKILDSELNKELYVKELVKLQLTERLNCCENLTSLWVSQIALEKAPLSERLTFYMQMAERGEEFTSSLVENFSMLGLKDASPEDRLSLVIKLAQHGARELASKLSQLGLEQVEAPQLLDLYVTIVQNARPGTDPVTDLVLNWNVSKLLEVEPHQRLPLWIAMAKNGRRGARKGALDRIKLLNVEQIEPSKLLELWIAIAVQGLFLSLLRTIDSSLIEKLSFEERLRIGNAIGEDETASGRTLANQFHKFGFIQDFKACESFKAKASLCNRVAEELGNWGAAGLIKNFDKLGFEEATSTQRLALCSTLARKGILPAEYMATYFSRLGFGRTSEDTEARFKLCCLIKGIEGPIYHQGRVAIELAKNMEALGIEEVSYQNKIDFTMDLLNKDKWVAVDLKLGFFSPQKKDLLNCLKLCITLAETDRDVAISLAKNFETLQLPYSSMTEVEIQKLILLLNTLIRMGVSFENLPLKDKLIPDRMIVKIYLGILLDTSLPQTSCRILEDPRLRDIKPCLELILFKLPLEKDPHYQKMKEEFLSMLNNFQNLLESRREFKLFKDQFEKIKSQDSIFIQSQLVKVLAYATCIFSDIEPMKLDVMAKSRLVETILSHQNPSDRFLLIKELCIAASENIQDIKDLSQDENLSTNEKASSLSLALLNNIEKDWGKLTWLLLSNLKTMGLTQEAVVAIALSIDQRGFSTTKNLTTLLSFLHNLSQRGPFSSEKEQGERGSEKELLENYLIKTVWDNKTLEKIKFVQPKTTIEIKDGEKRRTKVDQEDPMKNFLVRAGIIKFDTKKPIKKNSKTMAEVKDEIQGSDNILTIVNRKQFFDFLHSNQTSSTFFMKHFQELFPVGKIEDLNEKFASTLGDINKFRDPKAFYTYVKLLKQLPKEDKDCVDKILIDYVSSVLNGTFKEERYSTKDNPHLEIIFKDPQLKSTWLQAEFPKHIANELYISESDDPCDLLLIGTEVQGSCQSVTSDASTSKCLLSYLMGGEIIPIVVKYPNGRLVARSLLRYLVDEKNNPVLLQEKIYTNKRGDLEIQKEINEWAIRKAQRMNCPLVSTREHNEKYRGEVKYLGGRTPFQYTDAGGGVKSGPFKIEELNLIYSPT